MSEELRKPPVVDLEALLQPISEENPSGESLRYSGLYDQIAEARRADDVDLGAWQKELKTADFRKVIELTVPALSTQTKDLQIAAWLSEALIKQHGFAGLRDGLKLAAGLQDRFWDTLHPQIEEGDMEGRANAVAWIDIQDTFAIKRVPITGGTGYTFFDYEDSKKYDLPEDMSSRTSDEQKQINALMAEGEAALKVTGDKWRREKVETRRAAMESINFDLEECVSAFNELNAVVEARYERNQMPGLGTLKKALDDVHTVVKKLLEEKRIEEPDPVAVEDEEQATGEPGSNGAGGSGARKGAIQSRKDALGRLNEIAVYFQTTEPHSPVSYLVQRAVKWGNMPLESWLQDVIKDESILVQLRQTLGFNTGADTNPDA
jgi:type VI secretion system protein ImpA